MVKEKKIKRFDKSYYLKVISEYIDKYDAAEETFDVKNKDFSSVEEVREYLSEHSKSWNKSIKSVDLAHLSIVFWNYYRERKEYYKSIDKNTSSSSEEEKVDDYIDLLNLPQISVHLTDLAMNSKDSFSPNNSNSALDANEQLNVQDETNTATTVAPSKDDLSIPIAVRKSPRKRSKPVSAINEEIYVKKKKNRKRKVTGFNSPNSPDYSKGSEQGEGDKKKCDLCHKGGYLLKCIKCLCAYHKKCIGSGFARKRKGKWLCVKCKPIKESSNDTDRIDELDQPRRNPRRTKTKKIYFTESKRESDDYVEEEFDSGDTDSHSDTNRKNTNSDESSEDSSVASFLLESDDVSASAEEKSHDGDDDSKRTKSKIKKNCRVCKEASDELAECSRCNSTFHPQCMLPAFSTTPIGPWYCFICETKRYTRPIETILHWRFVECQPTERQLAQGAINAPYKTRSFFVKFHMQCYWKCRWVSETYVKYFHASLYGGYKKRNSLDQEPELEEGFNPVTSSWNPDESNDYSDSNLEDRFYRFGIKPVWLDVDRIVNEKEKKGRTKYLIKWTELPYEKCTWEYHDAPYFEAIPGSVQDALKRYSKHKKEIKKRKNSLIRPTPSYIAYSQQPTFLPKDYKLQSYQIHGVNWLRYSWDSDVNCILADEMGLGKTIQTITFLYSLYKEGKSVGPFLVSAPLSTVPNWEREFAAWAPDFHVVTYTGGKDNRGVIYDFEFLNEFGDQKPSSNPKFRFHVLLTSFEMVYVDSSILGGISWSVLVVDEAHRLKNSQSKYFKFLSRYKINYKLLLTGTPLQNTLEELYHLLLFLSPNDIEDKETFLARFEDISKEDQIVQLREILGPRLLRRLKQDVLKDLPTKSESIIRVDMSPLQKSYYKAVLTKNYSKFASKSSSSSSLMNVVMELKKCCNHPYLFTSAFEEAKRDEHGDLDATSFIEASGKLVVLQQMLTKLKQTDHRVLIFSQMTKMLDLLEDFLDYHDWKFQRIDGTVNTIKRQQAIDSFNAPDSNSFCFLLSTRAGGFGINLATADTVFIFDSDWNPHNDIQAFSRAHRIGQRSKVMIFRFVTRNSVEERIIQVAKRKMMLTHLVVRSGGLGDKSTGMTKRELDDILKFGTDDLFKEDFGSNESLKIVYDDKAIEDLLDRDKEQAIDEGSENNSVLNSYFESFKVADYATTKVEEKDEIEANPNESNSTVQKNDPDYWKKLMGEVVHKNVENDVTSQFGKGKRIRKRIHYYDVDVKDSKAVDSDFSVESDFEGSSDADEDVVDDAVETAYVPPTPYFQRVLDSGDPYKLGKYVSPTVQANIVTTKQFPQSHGAIHTSTSGVVSKVGEVSWREISIRTIRLINMAIFRHGLPPVSYKDMKTRWCPSGLKTKPESVVRAYVQALVEYLFSPDSTVHVTSAGLRAPSPMHSQITLTAVAPTSVREESSQQIANRSSSSAQNEQYDFRDINKDHICQRIALMDIIRDKVFEYMRFSPYLYPILVLEGLIPAEKLAYQFPSSVRLCRKDSTNNRLEVFDLARSSYDYVYPGDIKQLEEWGYEFHFNIEDCYNTDLHYVWHAEETQRNTNIWWRFHDMWLIVGIAVHGFGKLNEIFDDPRLDAINRPFRHHEGNRSFKTDFVMRRLKLLEQSLIAERVFHYSQLNNATISLTVQPTQMMNTYYNLRRLLHGTEQIIENVSSRHWNESVSIFNIMKLVRDLIEQLGREMNEHKASYTHSSTRNLLAQIRLPSLEQLYHLVASCVRLE